MLPISFYWLNSLKVRNFLVLFGVFCLAFLSSCEDEPVPRDYPRVRTLEVTNITEDGAKFEAEVYDKGSMEITEHGFTWSLSTPDIKSSEKVLLGSFSGTGRYEATITTALAEGATYEVCAFVVAGEYTVYGEKIEFVSLGSGAPEIFNFIPTSAGWGDTIAVTGKHFSYLSYTNKVFVEGQECYVVFASDSLLKFLLPTTVTSPLNSVAVSIMGNSVTADSKLTFIPPEVYGFTPEAGHWGDTVTLAGHKLGYIGFVPSDGMLLNGSLLCRPVRQGYDFASFVIPGQLDVPVSSVSLSYNSLIFSLTGSLTLMPSETDSIKPSTGTWGTSVTLYGKFNQLTDRSKVMFGDKEAQIISCSTDSLVVKVPDNLSDYISVINYSSQPFSSDFEETFTLKSPEIYDFEPKTGYAGNLITIRGKYFKRDVTTVEIGGKSASVKSVNDSIITCYVPGDVYDNCAVSVSLLGYTAVAGDMFNATNHVITGVTPLSVTYGDVITITGKYFHPETVIYLNHILVALLSVNENEIKFIAPNWLNYNPWSITATCNFLNDYWFTSSYTFQDQLQLIDFTITDVTPLSGKTADLITITGTNLHYPYVTFGSVEAEVTGSTSTQMTVKVPPLSSGEHTVNVTVGDRTHAYPFMYTHSGPWRRLTDVPFLYDYGCAFDFGEEAYVLTGREYGPYEKEIYRFDPGAEGFSRIPGTFLSEVLNPISCTLDGKGYIIGQKSSSYTGIGFEVFNPDSLTLRKLPDYPGTSIVNPCIISDDSVIYAGCGKVASSNSFDWYKNFWKFSPATNKWTRLADCPYNVSFSNQIYIDGRLIFLANLYNTGGVRYLLEYHPLTNTWTQTELYESDLGYWLLNDIKYGAKVSVVNNGKWYIGFGDWYQTNENYGVTNPDINNRFYCFDPSDDSWKTITDVACPARTFAFSFSYDGKIYIGGHQIYQWYDFWVYDPAFDQ